MSCGVVLKIRVCKVHCAVVVDGAAVGACAVALKIAVGESESAIIPYSTAVVGCTVVYKLGFVGVEGKFTS